MIYKILTIQSFDKQLKKLAKKYPLLKNEITMLGESLTLNPKQGIDLGKSCYKIRLGIESKGRGKKGGDIVITHVYVEGEKVYLLSIYDKSEQSDISESEILNLLSLIKE